MIKLSKRQVTILGLLDGGMSNAQLAEALSISEHTVKVHLWRLFRRIDVHSRLEAAKWWRDNGPASATTNSAAHDMLTALKLSLPVLVAARQQWPRSPFDDSIDVVEVVRAAITRGEPK
jgi:DNA-binding CsgD family transcriptional regulator